MKKGLVCTVLLMLGLMSVTAASPDSKRTVTVPRAVSGELEGFLHFVPFDYNGDGIFDFLDVITTGDAIGELPHLGLATSHTTQRPMPDNSVVDGHITITAANGDQIYGTYVGETLPGTQPGHLTGLASITITGGTGRFANATGDLDAVADVTMGPLTYEALWPVTWVLTGTVSY